jgi:hypothetical protein
LPEALEQPADRAGAKLHSADGDALILGVDELHDRISSGSYD